MSANSGKIIKILFVCHGNICRSPMAEFVMKDLAEKAGIGDRVYIASAATSSEEIGSPVHRGTVKELEKRGISCAGKYAVKLERADYAYYDHIVGMDIYNIRNMLRLFGGDPENKVRLLMSFAGESRDVDDPWYTRDFLTAYSDIFSGCSALLKVVRDELRP